MMSRWVIVTRRVGYVWRLGGGGWGREGARLSVRDDTV